MRSEHEGLRLWYGEPDTPAPREIVAAGTEITLTLGVQPADANNRVRILYRTNSGPTETVPARLLWSGPSGRTQYYRAYLPAFRAGDTVEYVPTFYRAGRQVPAPEDAPQSVSSFRVTGTGDDATPRFEPEEVFAPEARLPSSALGMDYAFSPGTDKTGYATKMRALLSNRPNTTLIREQVARRRSISNVASFLEYLVTNPNIPKPVGNLLLASHGIDQGGMEIALVGAQSNTKTTYEVLEELVSSPSGSPVRIPDALRQRGGTAVHIRGCSIGKWKPFVQKLKQAFGEEIKVTAPKHVHIVHPFGPMHYWGEFLAYHFKVARKKKLPNRDAVVAAFQNRIPPFEFIPSAPGSVGSPVPDNMWQSWIPKQFDQEALTRKPMYVDLGIKIEGTNRTDVGRSYSYERNYFDYTITLSANPGNEAKQLEALRAAFDNDKRFNKYHDLPVYERYGYDDVPGFVDGWKWHFDWKPPTLVCTGMRHKYSVYIPIRDPATNRLIFNYFPSRGSGVVPFISLVESDRRMFESV